MGVSIFSVECLLHQSAGNSHRGKLLCCVSEILRQRRNLCMRGGGSRFAVEHFLS